MLIYKITNLKNGKIYIGKTTTTLEKRWELHLRHAFIEKRTTYFCNAIRKNGKESFKLEILVDEISSDIELNKLEIALISEHNATDRLMGYNLLKGGAGGFTKEMRDKATKARKEKGISSAHLKALHEGRARFGYKPLTVDAKNNISMKLREYYTNPDNYKNLCERNKLNARSGKNHHMWGKTHTTATRKLISKARLGKKYDEIYDKETMIRIIKGKKKLKGDKNPNYCNIDLEMLELFASDPFIKVSELCKKLNVSRPTLGKRFKKFFKIENLQKYRHGKSFIYLQSFFTEVLIAFKRDCKHGDI